jgi:hypothetical protein
VIEFPEQCDGVNQCPGGRCDPFNCVCIPCVCTAKEIENCELLGRPCCILNDPMVGCFADCRFQCD